MRTICLTVLLAGTTGCVLLAGERSEVPVPGVYPGDLQTPGRSSGGGRDESWLPVEEHVSVLVLPGSLASMLTEIPPVGTAPIDASGYAWPAALQLMAFDADGVELRGVAVSASQLAGEITCLGTPPGAPLAVVVRIRGDRQGLRVEARVEAPVTAPCHISWSGRKRIDAVAADVWMWARSVVVRGSVVPITQ